VSEPSRFSDADGDGLPDAWERRVGLVVGAGGDDGQTDRDGDGVSNKGEWLAGTDPLRADSHLRLDAAALADGRVRLRWARVPGKPVVVRVRESWNGPERVLQPVPGRGSAGVEEVVDDAGAASRFYRLTGW